MFCTNCGSSLREGQKFCENCGAPVAQQAAVQAMPQTQAAVQAEPQVQPPVYAAEPPVYEGPDYENSYENGYARNDTAYTQNQTARSGGRRRARSVTGCGVKLAITRFFQNYCEFEGRSSRSEYWWPFLMNWAIGIVAGWLSKISPAISTIVFLALLLPGLGVFVRREHDIGRSWTRIFVVLIPIVGVILLLVDMLKPGEGANRYGPAPIPCDEDPDCFDV